ncbi:MAG: metallophosphatase [Maribacter sp.]|nr:metallophosphatase [Maribacter sp.]
MNRRKFLENSVLSSTYLGLGGASLSSCYRTSQKKITILHTNDVHSHIDPFPKDHSQYANLGGVARRATLVDIFRNENPNTLLFDAGDIFQGTPYFNFYGGELEFKLMSMLRYDAATIGNHDFDNGVEGLFAQLPYAKFTFVSANYNFKNTVMEGHVKPYEMYVVNGIKIGVYGLGIELDGLVTKKLYKETEYLDPFEMALESERTLKNGQKCDLVICLSHLGYRYQIDNKPSDVLLAAKTRYTDLIIGGHTHTFLDKPVIVQNENGRDVLVNQVGCYGVNLGRIDFYFENNKHAKADAVNILI